VLHKLLLILLLLLLWDVLLHAGCVCLQHAK
jgi:hypothetical protein